MLSSKIKVHGNCLQRITLLSTNINDFTTQPDDVLYAEIMHTGEIS